MKRKDGIDPNKEYSLREIHKLQLMPCKSYLTVRNKVWKDKANDNILKVEHRGENYSTMYLIRGENLIKYNKLNK